MENLGLNYLLGPALGLGLPGLFFLVWYFDGKARDRDARKYRDDMTTILNAYREDTKNMLVAFQTETRAILAAYQADMMAQRQMYENNVILVKAYEALSKDLREIVMLNTSQFQVLSYNVENNIFCPLNRVKKVAGVEA